jgi:hypothetical protein
MSHDAKQTLNPGQAAQNRSPKSPCNTHDDSTFSSLHGKDRPEMTYHYSSAPGPSEETVWRLCLLSPPFLLTGIGLLHRTAHDGFEAGTNRARLLGLPREMPLSLSTIPNCWQQTSQNLARHLAG